MSDQVILKIEKSLELIQGRLSFEENKLAECKKVMFDDLGNPRPSFIKEASDRKISIEELAARVEILKTSLEAAIADFPRRDRERARGAEIDLKIQAKKAEIESLRKKALSIQAEVNDLDEEKTEALAMSENTAKQVEAREADIEQIRALNRQERINQAESHLRGAILDLESAKRHPGHYPAAEMKNLENRKEMLQKKLDALRQTANV
jgi:chromosome segregation ATPase